MANNYNLIENSISQMGGGEFQNLCDQYLFAKYHLRFVTLGMMDGTDKPTKGIPDSFMCLTDSGKYIMAMYGTHKDTFAKLQKDLQEVLTKSNIPHSRISKVICCYGSGRITPEKNEILRSIVAPCTLQLISSSEIAMDLLQNYRWLAVEYCGLTDGTNQVFSLKKFIGRHDRSKTNAPLSTNFIDHDDQLKTIKQQIQEHDITVISGLPGVGKTRTAIEILKSIESEENAQCLAIRSNGQDAFLDFRGYLNSELPTYCLLDDATSISGLEGIISLTMDENFQGKLHLVLTVRKYLISELNSRLKQYDYSQIELALPTNANLNTMLEQFLPNEKLICERIVKLAHGNPRACVLAAKMVVNKGASVLIDSQSIISTYYEAVLSESSITREQRDTLFIIAIFERVQFVANDKLLPLLNFFEISPSQFERDVVLLHEKEICTIVGKSVVGIEDQSIQDYIRFQYLFQTQTYSIERLFERVYAFGFPVIVRLLNGATTIAANEEMEARIEDICRNFYNKKLQADDKVEFLKHFGSLMELEVMSVIEKLVDQTTTIKTVVNFNERDFDRSSKPSDIIELMGILCDRNPDNASFVLEQLQRYLRIDQSQVVAAYHLIYEYLGVQSDIADSDVMLRASVSILATIKVIDAPIIAELLFFVCKKFLKLRQDGVKSGNGRTITMWHFDYDDHSVNIEIRNKLWAIIYNVVKSGFVPIENWRILVSENKYYRENYQVIRSIDCKAMMKINDWFHEFSNSTTADLIGVDIVRIQYLSRKLELSQIKDRCSSVQWLNWQLRGYSNRHQGYIAPDENIQLDVTGRDIGETVARMSLQISSALSLQEQYPILANLRNWLVRQPKEEIEKFCTTVFKAGFPDPALLQLAIYQYSGRKFLNEWAPKFSQMPRTLYYALTLINSPTNAETLQMKNIIESLEAKDASVVSYSSMVGTYQMDNKLVDALLDMMKRTGNYSCINYLDHESAKLLVDHVDDIEKLKQLYLDGFEKHMDIENELLKYFENDDSFISEVITRLVNGQFGDYLDVNSEAISKLNECWNSVVFTSKLSHVFRNYINSGNQVALWKLEELFTDPSDDKCAWLLAELVAVNDDEEKAAFILSIVNRYFSNEQAIPFLVQVDRMGLRFSSKLPIFRSSYSWSGSEIPIVEKDIAFLKKMMNKIRSSRNRAFLREAISHLKRREEDIAAHEYLENIG